MKAEKKRLVFYSVVRWKWKRKKTTKQTLWQHSVDAGASTIQTDRVEFGLLSIFYDATRHHTLHRRGTAFSDPHIKRIMIELTTMATTSERERERMVDSLKFHMEIRRTKMWCKQNACSLHPNDLCSLCVSLVSCSWIISFYLTWIYVHFVQNQPHRLCKYTQRTLCLFSFIISHLNLQFAMYAETKLMEWCFFFRQQTELILHKTRVWLIEITCINIGKRVFEKDLNVETAWRNGT